MEWNLHNGPPKGLGGLVLRSGWTSLRRVFPYVMATLLTLAPAVHAETPPTKLTFGVVPQQTASTLARSWAPIFDRIGRESGVSVIFQTAPDIPEFERRLARGRYDLAYMNPYHYTVFHRDPGYEAFAKQKGHSIQGIVVVRRDSPIRDIRELEGMTLAFPAPAAFAASVLPRAHFRERRIGIEAKYVSSHDSVYRVVAQGLFPAGGGIERTLGSMDPAIRGQLRILWTTPRYTPHAFAAHPRVSPDLRERILAAMAALALDPAGVKLLKAINFDGIEAAADTDWDGIRALGIEALDAPIEGGR